MKTKMIVFDLDGTLLNDEHQLDSKTITALKLVRKKGIKTMIATGRMYCSAQPHIEKLEIKEPAITYNGALVINPTNQESIFHTPIPFKIAKKITKMVEENNYHLQLYINDTLYVSSENKITKKYTKISGIAPNPVGSLNDFLEEEPTKMLIIEEDPAKQVEINNFLKQNFTGKIELASSYPSFIEITKKGMSKAVPLKKLAQSFGIKQKEVMAFGDGLNDLKMIEWAGHGVAMQNAHPELQTKADDIALNNDDLGIARYLKKEFDLDLELN